MTRRRLPLGISDFGVLREEGAGYVYIDKTAEIETLLDSGKYLFLARPRRFGKSLLCSTLRCLYEGRRDLFADLAIEPRWDWSRSNPVVHLSINELGAQTVEDLDAGLYELVQEHAGLHGVTAGGASPAQCLTRLLKAIHADTGRRVVVIVDEYEKPVHDCLDDFPLARRMRDRLAAFYGAMKSCDGAIEKLFMTGIGRMVRTSVFSALNQMTDCTLLPVAATICGYTASEMRTAFAPWIDDLAAANGLTPSEAEQRLHERYNGYWWGSQDHEKVHNPWAILTACNERRFGSGWWTSGTPTSLIKLTEHLQLPATDLEGERVTDLDLLFDLERPRAVPLLWQTGYLTITDVTPRTYTLGYPNAEVREAWFATMLDRFAGGDGGDGSSAAARMLDSLERDDRPAFERTLTAFFAGIPSELTVEREAFYHTVFCCALQAAGARLVPEARSWRGRADAVLETPDIVYLIEFKLGNVDEAIPQIKDRRYHDAYADDPRRIVLLGAGGFAEKQVAVRWEELPR